METSQTDSTVIRQLDPIPGTDGDLTVAVLGRRGGDGMWHGRLRFETAAGRRLETGEILRARSDVEMLESVALLREYHLRDLFRSLD